MTTISGSQFNVSPFEKLGITVSNKKMTDEEIEKFKKLQEQGASQTGTAATGLLNTPIAVKGTGKTDHATLEKERARVEGNVTTPQTKLAAQTMGSEDAPSSLDQAVGRTVEEEFLDFSRKPWQERMRAMILKSMGLREEDLANISPEDREKIEAKIKEKIDEEIRKKTGMNATGAASAIATA
ncbi:MAG: hypothetical protein DI626_07060 [Micavibrio aeruginosavorus]|uniref:Uncharacterized protein n=1 Tax=Micavibrio aeruginosavorus TaxID=349221 RepID=A0A2W5BRB0_9BACT|nr:MAG: hypothetical protein DI626_07060 [Micavibrio aeruginosavorus]